jgi:hypothetical protein
MALAGVGTEILGGLVLNFIFPLGPAVKPRGRAPAVLEWIHTR